MSSSAAVSSTGGVLLWSAGVAVVVMLWRASHRSKRCVVPRTDQLLALFDRAPSGPIFLLNSLKFHARAVYADGRASHMSGSAAYGRYDVEHRKLIAKVGGRVVFSGDTNTLVIGHGTHKEYDRIELFEYPSIGAYNELATLVAGMGPDFNADFFAAVEYQTLVQCNPEDANAVSM